MDKVASPPGSGSHWRQLAGWWAREIPNSAGDLKIEQMFTRTVDGLWKVSRAVWLPGGDHEIEQSAAECRALAAGQIEAADVIEQADCDAVALSGRVDVAFARNGVTE